MLILNTNKKKSQLILRQQEKDIQNKERLSIYENQIHDYEEQIALNEQTLHSLKEHLQDQNLKIEFEYYAHALGE